MIRTRFLSALAFLLTTGMGCGGTAPSSYVAEPLDGAIQVAVLPLMNYTSARDAATQLQPMVGTELASRAGVLVVDPGRVEEALADEPWIMTDRVPPDLVDSLGVKLAVNTVVLGSVLEYGFRDAEGGQVPQVSLSLRMLETPGGRVLWSAVHSRDGSDHESVFGLGRTESLQSLALQTIREMMKTFPPVMPRKENDVGRDQKGSQAP